MPFASCSVVIALSSPPSKALDSHHFLLRYEPSRLLQGEDHRGNGVTSSTGFPIALVRSPYLYSVYYTLIAEVDNEEGTLGAA